MEHNDNRPAGLCIGIGALVCQAWSARLGLPGSPMHTAFCFCGCAGPLTWNWPLRWLDFKQQNALAPRAFQLLKAKFVCLVFHASFAAADMCALVREDTLEKAYLCLHEAVGGGAFLTVCGP